MAWCSTSEPSLQLYMITQLPARNTPQGTEHFISVISQVALPNKQSGIRKSMEFVMVWRSVAGTGQRVRHGTPHDPGPEQRVARWGGNRQLTHT